MLLFLIFVAMRIITLVITLLIAQCVVAQEVYDNSFDALMREYSMVDIQKIEPSILVELKYSTTDNFVGEDMYGELDCAYFATEFADRVVAAQRELQRRNPGLTLLIYDAARPISIQRSMRRAVEGTELEAFVADGSRGGRHNYGVAIDVTIATLDGHPLDMGCGFDDFTVAASVKETPDNSDSTTRTPNVYKTYLQKLVNKGIISAQAADNRLLLIEVMHSAGLYPYRREWWHFEEIMPMSDVRNKYRLLDF